MKRILLLTWVTAVLPSCSDYLNVVPDNTLTLADIFSVKEEAYNALSKIYSYMPADHDTHATTWSLGDEYIGRLDMNGNGELRAIRIMRGLQSVSSPVLGTWSGTEGGKKLYEAIRQTNVFIENIDRVADMNDTEKADWKAQAKFLKAYYHFLLLQKYGPIVISDRLVSPDTPPQELFVFRSKVEDCFDYIIGLVNEAIPDLKERASANDLGSVDKIAAMAIRARILFFRASPFYNGNREYFGDFYDFDGEPFFSATYDREKWKAAVDAIEEAITVALDNGKDLYAYEKEPYLYDRDNFEDNEERMKTFYDLRMMIVDPWNRELLWGNSNINFGSDGGLAQSTNIRLPAGYIEGGQVNVTSYSWQWMSATFKMLERYYTENGLPIDEDLTFDRGKMFNIVYLPGIEDPMYYRMSGLMQPGVETINLYLNRELRFYAHLGFTGGYWRGHITRINTMMYADKDGGLTSTSSTDYFCTGIGIKKFVHPESTSGNWTRQIRYPYPIIRLADLYLMKAEALNEYLDAPTQEVWDAVNIVRRRAGIPNVETVWSDPNLAKTPDRHKTKDGMRDIILHERGVELAFEGSRFWDMLRHKRAASEFSTPVWGWTHTGINAETFFIREVKQSRKFTITDCLWPISIDEMNTNANLKQNPGWR
ncbi:MAG: RagB/SusD family nutrient uptake outer membrane protein [Prevotellaceae bacterium]|nr:RagB/SusD family nutrient uptake outer membrane protein [Prevotellaceae bacterium]